MKNKLVSVFGLTALATALPLFGDAAGKQLTATKTERVNFAPGGTIRVEGSYGYLSVDGWDEPAVEVTVIKSTGRFYQPEQKEQALALLERLRVVTERKSDTELVISTDLPKRQTGFAPPLPVATKAHITPEYQIHVPRNSRLEIHNGTGYVWISDVTGDVDAASSTGDMIVNLPEPAAYSIDARTRFGSVSSDFVGKTRNQYLIGMGLSYAGETPAKRIHLRMGRGSITIKQMPPPWIVGKD
jgi:hypothetical protein